MKEARHSRIYTYVESLLPKDCKYQSSEITRHRILHNVALGAAAGLSCLIFTDSVLLRVGAGAVTALVCEFYVQPRLWAITKTITKTKT